MGRERRKWTEEEDSLLREAIQKATQESRPLLWRELAKNIPGRTNKDCRRRWCNTLADGMTKGSWTESEDERLCNAVREYGLKWTRVASAVETRNSDQCSSHWSQTLNPDIDYSDWTKDEDERLVHAVQRYGTNWTKLVSTYFPNRTALALKNRYSALRARTCQMHGTSRNKAKLKVKSPSFNATHPFNRPDFNDSTREVETDDEENDDDDQDESDDVGIEAGRLADMDWQKGLPVGTGAVRGLASSAHANSQFPSSQLPAKSDIEQFCHPISATVEQWNNEVQNPAVYSSIFPFDMVLNSYSENNSHMPLHSGVGTNGATLSVPPQSYQHPYKLNIPQATLPAHSYTANPTLNILPNSMSYNSEDGEAGSLARRDQSLPTTSRVNPTHETTVQQVYTMAQAQATMGQRSGQSPDHSEAPELASLSGQSLPSATPSTPDGTLHHVCIDAMCTTEQLGNVMRTIVGFSKSVTVKVGS